VYVDCTAKGLDGRKERLQKSGETLVSKALVIADRCRQSNPLVGAQRAFQR